MDCIEGMKNIPDASIDCIICDLPYGITSCSWDAVIPFNEMWEQYDRIAKDNAPIVLFSQQPFTSMLIASNVNDFKEEIIWRKNRASSGLHAKQRHLKVHENIIVFSKGKGYTYNPQKWSVAPERIIARKKFVYNENNNIIGFHKERTKKVDNGTRYPISVIDYKVPYSPKQNSSTRNGDYRIHPTQKPVDLLRYLVRTFSNENDVILDNCIGSGTTAIAAMLENRHYIGFEINSEFFDLAKTRIDTFKSENCCEKTNDIISFE